MKVIDYTPNVLEALKNGPLNSGDLTEAVWGSSGRNRPVLCRSLFPFTIRMGWVVMKKVGRSKLFYLTEKGRGLIGQGGPHTNWSFETHSFRS